MNTEMTLTLWTIQPLEWYENLLRNKTIHADVAKIEEPFYFEYAYQWLSKQMVDKIGKPAWAKQSTNLLPIWAWYQYNGVNKKRPDLRSSGHLTKGTKGVRIEFNKPADQVLLSDYDLWHAVLNNWYIADDEKEDKAFEVLLQSQGADNTYNPMTTTSNIQSIIEESWQKVLDLSYYSAYYATPSTQKIVQATCWDLSLDEIVQVDTFVAR